MDTVTLRLRVPQEDPQPTLRQLLARALPGADTSALLDAIRHGRVEADERPRRDPGYTPTPDMLIDARLEGLRITHEPVVEAQELARESHWVILDKPMGAPGELDRDDPMSPLMFMADMAGLDRDTFTPCWPMHELAGGPWLFGMTQDDAQALTDAIRSGELKLTWVVIVPRVGMPNGVLDGPEGIKLPYSASRMAGGLSELQISPDYRQASALAPIDPWRVLAQSLASAKLALLGDTTHGGYMVEGGLRMRLMVAMSEAHQLAHSWSTPQGWWPQAPVAPELPSALSPDEAEAAEALARANRPDTRPTTVRSFQVSSKTLEIMRAGHPWALDDSQTDRRDKTPPGTMVRLEDARGKRGAFALIEGEGEIAARRWSWEADEAEGFQDEIALRLDEAILRREALMRDAARTNLFRLVHGEADGLPGFYLDRIGTMLRATITSHACRAFKSKIYADLIDHDPAMTLLELVHLRDVRAGELPYARMVHSRSDYLKGQKRVIATEDGLRYWCEPWEGIDVGFFADQRENRRALRALAGPGQRWLNLFGHTGAFSVALAAQGAQVVNVDVSKRYLQWTAENFALNDLNPELHVGVAGDARAYVAEGEDQFDGIIIDPPTAAQGKGEFWSVRKDFRALLARCFGRLRPGGVMLVCRNDKQNMGGLDVLIQESAQAAGWKISALTIAPPAPDYPSLMGFPEGDTFEGWLVR